MTTGIKQPVIVIVAVAENLLPFVQEWRRERHLLSAKRVFPKGEENYGPITSQQLLRKIHYNQNLANQHYAPPQKTIIIAGSEEVLKEVREDLSHHRFYNPKQYEYHLVAQAKDVDPNRVGFFIGEG